jgi:Na+/proline symporter
VLAVFGDAGGAVGPWIAGAVADASTTGNALLSGLADLLPDDGGSGLRAGLLVAVAFPLVIVVVTLLYSARTRRAPGAASHEAPDPIGA